MSQDEMSFGIKCQIMEFWYVPFLQIWILLVKNLTLCSAKEDDDGKVCYNFSSHMKLPNEFCKMQLSTQ